MSVTIPATKEKQVDNRFLCYQPALNDSYFGYHYRKLNGILATNLRRDTGRVGRLHTQIR